VENDCVSVTPRPSRRLALAVIGAHLAACLSLGAAAGPGLILLAGSFALAASVSWMMLRGLQGIQASSMTINADGTCRWIARDGSFEGRMRGDSTVLPWLVVLRIKVAKERRLRTLVLCGDSTGRDDWRRLRVFLRWGVRFEGAAPALSGEPY
jgi:hypothetical protein